MSGDTRYPGLDAWRAVSILAVMAGHLLPLGPKAFQINAAATAFGMAIFFVLSGFLITTMLLQGSGVKKFLIRRAARILPLAWAGIVFAYLFAEMQGDAVLANLLFYANWPPMQIVHPLQHYWSLCVEVQFYVAVALLVWICGKKSLYLLPVVGLGFTLLRWTHGVPIAINTPYRIDEILAGATLAVTYFHFKERAAIADAPYAKTRLVLVAVSLLILLFLASHPALPNFAYAKPYLAALLVGTALFFPRSTLPKTANHPWVIYVASISYALYVTHLFLLHGWIAEGSLLEKYVKRLCLGFPLIWLVSHLSTKYFEQAFIRLARSDTKDSLKVRA